MARRRCASNELAAPAPDRGDQIDLERALAQLGDTARAVVWLHDVEGYTHAEIGALFDATPSFSKSQLARAHERLRGLLQPDGSRGVMHARIEQLLSLRDGEPVDARRARTRRSMRAMHRIAGRLARCANGCRHCPSHLELRGDVAGHPRSIGAARHANRVAHALVTRGSLAASVASLAIATAWRLHEPAARAGGPARCRRRTPHSWRWPPIGWSSCARNRRRSRICWPSCRSSPPSSAQARRCRSTRSRRRCSGSITRSCWWRRVRPDAAEQLWRERVEAMNSLVRLRYADAQRVAM